MACITPIFYQSPQVGCIDLRMLNKHGGDVAHNENLRVVWLADFEKPRKHWHDFGLGTCRVTLKKSGSGSIGALQGLDRGSYRKYEKLHFLRFLGYAY